MVNKRNKINALNIKIFNAIKTKAFGGLNGYFRTIYEKNTYNTKTQSLREISNDTAGAIYAMTKSIHAYEVLVATLTPA